MKRLFLLVPALLMVCGPTMAQDYKPQSALSAVPPNPMSMKEMDMIRLQIMRCWRMPAQDDQNQIPVAVLNISLKPDGSLAKPPSLAENQQLYASDPRFRVAADSALRAVMRCTPLKDLPANRYEAWKNFEMHFDPHHLIER